MVVAGTVVGAFATVGAGAVVVAGVRIGRFATVGAGAIVTRDVPDFALVAGNPARRLGWVCACGARLNDQTGRPATPNPTREASLDCARCGRAYAFHPQSGELEERPASNRGVQQ